RWPDEPLAPIQVDADLTVTQSARIEELGQGLGAPGTHTRLVLQHVPHLVGGGRHEDGRFARRDPAAYAFPAGTRPSAAALIRSRVWPIPASSSSSKFSVPPRTVRVRKFDRLETPFGARRLSVNLVPVVVGSRSN